MLRVGRRCRMMVLITSFFAFACGGDPPEKEMQQAQGAIDAARAAGADQYARDEFVAANEALKHAREAVDDRDYRLALNNALDSREHAQNAAKATADNKAIARADADHALAGAATALTEARGRLRAPEASQAPAKVLALRHTIADADAAVQKASAAFKEGDYASVTSRMREITGRLRVATSDLENAIAHRHR
jgi:hypothetical protein